MSKSITDKELQYRPEIDGLRALAIISVFLYHINESLLPGGYIGVDIFFVLSGYLITKGIFTKIQTKTFNIKDFYSRRITRLLPSLYIVLFFSLIASYSLMIPSDIHDVNASLIKVMTFWSNQHFAIGRDYFSMLSNEIPLLHTWSLAVEEQFYFIWPLILMLLIFIKLPKKSIVIISCILVLLSLGYGTYSNIKINSTYAYYVFPTRFGELLIGAIFAILNFKTTKLKAYYSLLGLIMVLYSFIAIDKSFIFPGLITLIPCLGTVLLLQSNDNIFTSWLKYKPLQFIGKISYQLYLWHWPLLAISRYVSGQYNLSLINYLLVILLTISLSFIIWKYIETPIRYKRISFLKAFCCYYIAPTFILLLLIKLSPFTFFKSQYFTQNEFSSYGATEICHESIKDLSICTKGAKKNKPDILIFGDSHTAHLNYFFDELGKNQGLSFLIVSGTSCSPILDFDEDTLTDNIAKEHCRVLKNFVKENFKNFETIILSSRWDLHLGYSEQKHDLNYYNKLLSTLEILKNKKIYLVTQVPLLDRSPQRTELINYRFSHAFPVHHFDSKNQHNEDIKKIANLYPSIRILDLNTFIKNLFSQKSFQDNTPFYKDKDHLNINGERQLAKAVKNAKEFKLEK